MKHNLLTSYFRKSPAYGICIVPQLKKEKIPGGSKCNALQRFWKGFAALVDDVVDVVKCLCFISYSVFHPKSLWSTWFCSIFFFLNVSPAFEVVKTSNDNAMFSLQIEI